MLRSVLKMAWRGLWRNRLYALLNMTGLAVGLASAVLLLLWVQNERSFDTYHRQTDHLYRVTNTLDVADEPWVWSSSPMVLAGAAQQRVPGIVRLARLKTPYAPVLRVRNEYLVEKNVAYVDSSWFQIFDYQFLAGNAQQALAEPDGVVLTQTKAETWFGNVASAMGSVVELDSVPYTVRGVVQDNPTNSSFRYDVLFPNAAGLRTAQQRNDERNWGEFNCQLFVQLNPSTRPAAVGSQLTQLYRELKKDSSITASLLPLREIHFATDFKDDGLSKGNAQTANTLGLIGGLILVIASINCVNLTTALASQRTKEVGMKKIVGAGRVRLLGQFLLESGLLVGAAVGVALGLMYLALPGFNAFTGQAFRLGEGNVAFWVILLGCAGLTVLLSGAYPALLLSSLQPLRVLRGGNVLGSRNSRLRQGLVVVQFVVSMALIVSTFVIHRQLHYVQTMDPGYARAHIFSFTLPFDVGGVRENRAYFKQQLQSHSGVAGVTSANQPIVSINSSHSGSLKWAGKPDDFTPAVSQFSVEPETQAFFGLKLAAGRWFQRNMTLDTANVVLNETAVRALSLKAPVVGQWFEFQGRRGQIIGVAKDFHFKSLHEKINPMVMFYAPNWQAYVMVKTAPGQAAPVLAETERRWHERYPNRPFRYEFLDDQFNQLYKADQQAGQLFNAFSTVAILISCLGLFGLATFAAERRIREIGIRKVLGASVASIVTLLSKDFLKLVLVAIVIASPLAYYVMQRWLADFAYRIDIEWWVFAGAGLLAVGIALLTVSFQSVKAALMNPVKSLRSE